MHSHSLHTSCGGFIASSWSCLNFFNAACREMRGFLKLPVVFLRDASLGRLKSELNTGFSRNLLGISNYYIQLTLACSHLVEPYVTQEKLIPQSLRTILALRHTLLSNKCCVELEALYEEPHAVDKTGEVPTFSHTVHEGLPILHCFDFFQRPRVEVNHQIARRQLKLALQSRHLPSHQQILHRQTAVLLAQIL